jgi:hypothetical protein
MGRVKKATPTAPVTRESTEMARDRDLALCMTQKGMHYIKETGTKMHGMVMGHCFITNKLDLRGKVNMKEILPRVSSVATESTHTPDETIIEGQWLDDIPRDGDWTINYPDGSKFYGFATFRHPEDSVHDDTASGVSESSRGSTRKTSEVLRVPLPHGFGTLTYQSGQRYVGSFVYGDFQDT